MRTDCLNTLLGVSIQKEHLSVPGLVLITKKAVFIAAVNSPNLRLCVLEGEGKGKSGQPVFPSFSRSLLQGLPTSDFSATSPPCAFDLIRPFTPHLDAASSWILEGMMHNRFQGNHDAKIWWVALEKAIFSPACKLLTEH